MTSASVQLPIANPSPAELALLERYVAMPGDPRRERAFAAFASTGLPSRRVEAFRWTDFRAQAGKPETWESGRLAPDALAHLPAALVRIGSDGYSVSGGLPAGVRVQALPSGQGLAGAEEAPLGSLAAALADRRCSVGIEIGQSLQEPLRLVFASELGLNAHRVLVIVRAGVHARILESHLGGAGFGATLVEYEIEPGAEVTRTLFQSAAGPAVVAVTARVTLEADARFFQHTLAFGAKLARVETQLVHAGAGSSAELDAAYVVPGGKHVDLTSHVRHSLAGSRTRQLTRGVVAGDGRAVFQGKFHVARHAIRTDARMTHNALVLSQEAAVFAKPELQIHADDVQCAHGNTVGQLDRAQVFYLRQRGLPKAEAEALLARAFVVEALGDVDADPARQALSEALEVQLAALLGASGANVEPERGQ